MSICLAIQSYPGANEIVRRHWPFYEKAGADEIVGIGTECGLCRFPLFYELNRSESGIRIGRNEYLNGDALPRRLINTFRWLLENTDHDELCVIEYDTIFLKPIPRPIVGCAACLAGFNVGTKAPRFYHNPWMADRETATEIVRAGTEMLAAGDFDHPSPDVFFGYITCKAGIHVNSGHMSEYTRNSLDIQCQLEEARQAVRAGVHCVHGVKTASELEYILW